MEQKLVKIIKMFIEAVNVVNENAKKPRNYGTGVLLYQAEIHTLSAIYSNSGVNASELARILGITNGAVTQVVEKLYSKGLLEKYREDNNRKEVYYSLTESGIKACENHRKHEENILAGTLGFLKGLDSNGLEAISTFMETLTKELKQKT